MDDPLLAELTKRLYLAPSANKYRWYTSTSDIPRSPTLSTATTEPQGDLTIPAGSTDVRVGILAQNGTVHELVVDIRNKDLNINGYAAFASVTRIPFYSLQWRGSAIIDGVAYTLYVIMGVGTESRNQAKFTVASGKSPYMLSYKPDGYLGINATVVPPKRVSIAPFDISTSNNLFSLSQSKKYQLVLPSPNSARFKWEEVPSADSDDTGGTSILDNRLLKTNPLRSTFWYYTPKDLPRSSDFPRVSITDISSTMEFANSSAIRGAYVFLLYQGSDTSFPPSLKGVLRFNENRAVVVGDPSDTNQVSEFHPEEGGKKVYYRWQLETTANMTVPIEGGTRSSSTRVYRLEESTDPTFTTWKRVVLDDRNAETSIFQTNVNSSEYPLNAEFQAENTYYINAKQILPDEPQNITPTQLDATNSPTSTNNTPKYDATTKKIMWTPGSPSGGTNVVANPSSNTGDALTGLQVGNTKYRILPTPINRAVIYPIMKEILIDGQNTSLSEVDDDETIAINTMGTPEDTGTNVVANPSGTGGTKLTRLQVGDTKYQLASGEDNVQPDWDQDDANKDDYIKNRPTNLLKRDGVHNWALDSNTDVIPTEKLGEGIPTVQRFLRGDGKWAFPNPPTGISDNPYHYDLSLNMGTSPSFTITQDDLNLPITLPTTGDGTSFTLTEKYKVPGGIQADRKFLTTYEGAIEISVDQSTTLYCTISFSHILLNEDGTTLAEFVSKRPDQLFAVGGGTSYLQLNVFNAQTTLKLGMQPTRDGTMINVTQELLNRDLKLAISLSIRAGRANTQLTSLRASRTTAIHFTQLSDILQPTNGKDGVGIESIESSGSHVDILLTDNSKYGFDIPTVDLPTSAVGGSGLNREQRAVLDAIPTETEWKNSWTVEPDPKGIKAPTTIDYDILALKTDDTPNATNISQRKDWANRRAFDIGENGNFNIYIRVPKDVVLDGRLLIGGLAQDIVAEVNRFTKLGNIGDHDFYYFNSGVGSGNRYILIVTNGSASIIWQFLVLLEVKGLVPEGVDIVDRFIGLKDTPNQYAANSVPVVNEQADALNFVPHYNILPLTQSEYDALDEYADKTLYVIV